MNIVVYCSSRDSLPEEYQQAAQATGKWIGEHHHTLVFGGVKSGLMHTVAQATADAGGKVVGIVPHTFMHRVDPVCTEVVECNNLSDRKDLMIGRGDAFICLPGGIGTIDEWISTLSQLIVDGLEEQKPIFAINLHNMFDGTIAQLASTAASPLARGKHIDCSHIATDTAQLINLLNKHICNL